MPNKIIKFRKKGYKIDAVFNEEGKLNDLYGKVNSIKPVYYGTKR